MSVSDRVKAQLSRMTSGGGSVEARYVQQPGIRVGSFMFVPPFNSLLKAIGLTRTEFEASKQVTIPTELFKLLLQVTIANSDFNEAGYLTHLIHGNSATRRKTLDFQWVTMS